MRLSPHFGFSHGRLKTLRRFSPLGTTDVASSDILRLRAAAAKGVKTDAHAPEWYIRVFFKE